MKDYTKLENWTEHKYEDPSNWKINEKKDKIEGVAKVAEVGEKTVGGGIGELREETEDAPRQRKRKYSFSPRKRTGGTYSKEEGRKN